MSSKEEIKQFLRNDSVISVVDTLNSVLDVIGVKFHRNVAEEDLRGDIINKFNAYVSDFLKGIEPLVGEIITKTKLLNERKKDGILSTITDAAVDLAASYIDKSKFKIGGNSDVPSDKESIKDIKVTNETGFRTIQNSSKNSSGESFVIENEQIFGKDSQDEVRQLEKLRKQGIILVKPNAVALERMYTSFRESFDKRDVTVRETINMMRSLQQYADDAALINGWTIPGLHVIYGRTNVGKSRKLHQVYSTLLRSQIPCKFIYASEPHPYSIGSAKDALDIITLKICHVIDTKDVYDNHVFVVDSLRDIVYLQGGLAAGGVSTTSYELLTTLSAMCMSTNTTIITAINPTSDDDKVYNSLMHAITSSVTSMTELTKATEKTTFRRKVLGSDGNLDHYERVDDIDLLDMLLLPNSKELTDPNIPTNDLLLKVKARKRTSFLGV